MLRRTGRAPPGDEVEAVWTATEGWPLGVALAASSDRPPVGSAGAGGRARHVPDRGVAGPSGAAPARRDHRLQRRAGARSVTGARARDCPRISWSRCAGAASRCSAAAVDDGRLAYHPLVRDLLAARLVRERPAARRCAAARGRRRGAGSGRTRARGGRALAGGRAARPRERTGRPPRRGAAGDRAGHGRALARATARGRAYRARAATARGPARRAGRDAWRTRKRRCGTRWRGTRRSGDDEQAWVGPRRPRATPTCVRQRFDAAVRLADGYASSSAVAAPMVALIGGRRPRRRRSYRRGLGAVRGRRGAVRRRSARVAGAGPSTGSSWTFRAGGSTPRSRACARRWRSSSAPIRSAGCLMLLGMAAPIHDERGEPDGGARVLRRSPSGWPSRRRSAGTSATSATCSGRARMRAPGGWPTPSWRSRGPRVDCPGGTRATTEVTRATIAAGRGDYDGARASDRRRGARALDPRLRATALLIAGARRGRSPRSRPRAGGRGPRRPSGAGLGRPPARAARVAAAASTATRPARSPTSTLAWEEAGDGAQHLLRRERPRLEPLAVGARSSAGRWRRRASSPRWMPLCRVAPRCLRSRVIRCRRSGAPRSWRPSPPDIPARSRARERAASPIPIRPSRAPRAPGAPACEAEPPPLVFTVLGGFALRRGAFRIDDDAWRRRAAQRLVRILLMHRDAAMSEDALFAALWPDKTGGGRAPQPPGDRLGGARASSTGRARSTASCSWPGAPTASELAERDVVDADEFERAAAAALGARGRDRPRCSRRPRAGGRASRCPRTATKTGRCPARERLIDLYGRLLTALAEARSAPGDDPGAVDAHRRHIELDPLDEAAQRGLMLRLRPLRPAQSRPAPVPRLPARARGRAGDRAGAGDVALQRLILAGETGLSHRIVSDPRRGLRGLRGRRDRFGRAEPCPGG